MNKPFIPNIQARASLVNKLDLEFNENMQDWEYEVSDIHRIYDSIDEYNKQEISNAEKESLMEIILNCINDILANKQNELFLEVSKCTLPLLKENQKLHEGTINYWCQNNFSISDWINKSLI